MAVIDLLEDLFARGVWCIGFFMVDARLHGSGAASRLHEALVDWMRSRGARWCRLGVIEVNERGRRFWRSRGYREVRRRLDYPVGARRHTLHVLVRALHDEPDWEAYRLLVPRDDPAMP
jgi:GNAT superfamily N-acetyltransferase